MNPSIITIIVSLIAATTSLVSILITVFSNLKKEIRDENRKQIEPLLEELGKSLYGMIAAIVLLYKDSSIKNQKYWNNQVVEIQRSLRGLRTKLRYSLWGFDSAIKTLILLPGLAKLCDQKELYDVITLATDLRVTMDNTIRKCFKYGRTPTFLERQLVKYRVNKLLNKWEDLKSNEQEDLQPESNSFIVKKNFDKIIATVIAVRESDFDAKDSQGNTYSINKKSKIDNKSSKLLVAGSQLYLFKRNNDRNFHYSFLRTPS